MRALRFHGNKDIRVDEIDEPRCRPGWVKIKNAWAGICGSDLHEYLVGPRGAPTTPHRITGETIPTVFGQSLDFHLPLFRDISLSFERERDLAWYMC